MKLLDGKSILFGAGLGVILTALLGLLFFLGYNPAMTDEQIISRAEKLGMVHSEIETKMDGINKLSNGSWSITVIEGEDIATISGRLSNAGIIQSAIEFQIFYKKNFQDVAPTPGTFVLPANFVPLDLATMLAKGANQ